jgi:hypothetical protein
MVSRHLPVIALLLIGDGRDTLRHETVKSFQYHAHEYDLAQLIEVDDRLHMLGFCGAIRYGWDRLREVRRDFDYVWHQEEDWRFLRSFSLKSMARVLSDEPSVAQVALRRGPEPGETQPLVEAFAADFEERITGLEVWLEHRLFWTTNPCLYRAELLDEYQWPEGPLCEAAFGQTLITEGCSFAYWGARTDEPWIEHTGARTGLGY